MHTVRGGLDRHQKIVHVLQNRPHCQRGTEKGDWPSLDDALLLVNLQGAGSKLLPTDLECKPKTKKKEMHCPWVTAPRGLVAVSATYHESHQHKRQTRT